MANISRGANLGLETIASFYAEDGQAGALRNMKQEIRALEEAKVDVMIVGRGGGSRLLESAPHNLQAADAWT